MANNTSLIYYNAALGKQHYKDSLYFSIAANVVTDTIPGQPALTNVGGSTLTQQQVDDFLGIPGDLDVNEVSGAGALDANSMAVVVNMGGQADPLALGVQGVGSVGQLRVLGLNNNGGVPATEGGKKMVHQQTDSLMTGTPAVTNAALVTPAGNLAFRFQLPDPTWGVVPQTFSQISGSIELVIQWFPK